MSPATLTDSTARVVHRPADAGQSYVGPGDVYRFLVTGEETGGAYFAMEAIVAPGGGPPPHIHRNEDETLYVLEGEVEFHTDGGPRRAGPGSFFAAPRGTAHGFRNPGQTPLRVLNVHAPEGGFVGRVRGG